MGKIDKLAEVEGFDSVEEMLEQYGDDSVVPGICMTPSCSYTDMVEPDCTDGYCDVCNKNTVQSMMILLECI